VLYSSYVNQCNLAFKLAWQCQYVVIRAVRDCELTDDLTIWLDTDWIFSTSLVVNKCIFMLVIINLLAFMLLMFSVREKSRSRCIPVSSSSAEKRLLTFLKVVHWMLLLFLAVIFTTVECYFHDCFHKDWKNIFESQTQVCWVLGLLGLNPGFFTSDDSIYRIENIDISFSISMYRIVEKKTNFLIYRDIFCLSHYVRCIVIFCARSLYLYYCITKIMRINGENDKLTKANWL